MEKNQSKLCFEILRRFHKAGVLDDFILIGSWCVYFYQDYFSDVSYLDHISIKTRDIDFLISDPSHIRQEVDIPMLLKDLGYVTIYKGTKGYIKLDHPDLLLEFLVIERGRGTNKPHPLPKLGVNAVALRFLNFLTIKTIKVPVEDFYLTLPHPANFALHKLIIFQRRLKVDKASKDRNTAIEILKALINKGESKMIRQVFDSVPKKWQLKIIQGLSEPVDKDILAVLFTNSQ
ncbi:MAG: GSU2403 family nucleotidyltransferase fold protein [Candidatus Omnitrophica bacterium]|nr:GSU2403 family nucleotidyltransferase fold protein [Candidatus Omnitrophota bacterium]